MQELGTYHVVRLCASSSRAAAREEKCIRHCSSAVRQFVTKSCEGKDSVFIEKNDKIVIKMGNSGIL